MTNNMMTHCGNIARAHTHTHPITIYQWIWGNTIINNSQYVQKAGLQHTNLLKMMMRRRVLIGLDSGNPIHFSLTCHHFFQQVKA